MKRRPLIAGNWKMNGSRKGASVLAQSIHDGLSGARADVALCPPFVYLDAAMEASLPMLAYGAQDVSAHDDGAYTGEISAAMLADMGCKYVIVGHSERRQYHGEVDTLIAAKAGKAIASGVVPIICVGETLAQREAGLTAEVIAAQIAASVPEAATGANIVIAYEPVWAIGTGLTATTAQISEVHAQIRGLLEKRLADGGVLRIIYGGSVKAENAREILALADVDGALVGGASLKAESFLAIINAVGD